MSDSYSIIDFDGFCDSIRKGAADSFTEKYEENLDDFISVQQVANIVKSKSLGQDDDGYYVISEEIFDDIFADIRDWLYGVGLARLAAKGHVECAWDNDINEMVFWLPENKNPANNKT
jgi:hypothetical protein